MKEQKQVSMGKSIKELNALLIQQTAELALKNRELEIEAALERVRSRSLAMHKSDELQEVITVVLEQLQKLGIKPETAYISINYEDTRDFDMWFAAPGIVYAQKIHIPYFKHAILDDVLIAIDRGDSFLASDYSLEGKNSFFKYAFEHSDLKIMPDDRKKHMLESKGFARSVAFSKNSTIGIQNYEGIPFTDQENEIIKRFARVFEQAYTRFLDVKKAEEQAREAQIESALERVRASSLAMHHSDDLHHVIKVVSDQLLWLGLYFEATQFTIVNPDRSWDSWLSVPRQPYPARINIPYTDHKMFHKVEDAIQNQTDFFTIELTKDEKDSFYTHFFQNTLARNTPEERKQYILNSKCFTCSIAYQKKISLSLTVHNFEEIPYTDQENSIIKRFGNVFEQAYIRFLDLLKAEAQAKEAQIEAALERVRGKAMGMHSSEDLAATILAFYHELVGLSSVPIIRCGAGLLNKENCIVDISSISKTSAGDLVEAIGKIDMSGHPMLKNAYDHCILQEEYHHILRGNEIKVYYQYARKQIAFPDYSDDVVQFAYFLMFKEGSFYVFTENELSEQELQIYRRFMSVLSLTYKRYKDLKDAEERTRIAVKEASLDRVRAEIASMRHADDLQRITPLVWRELLALGVPFFRCGVMIMDEKEEMVRFYLSTPDGKSLAALNLETNSLAITRNGVDHWRRQKVYTETWNKEQFIGFMKPLMAQGQIQTAATYQGGEEPPESLTLQFVPFPQGMLYVGSSKPLTSAEIEPVKALADAFSVAYSRYEDFTNLEAAKALVEETLHDLRTTQTQLVQSEKMASLGELTAGIAHEIQNPLNFVNNFSEVNSELIGEMEEEIDKGNLDEAKKIAKDIRENQQKINLHGKRADSIVKGMLQHSRSSSGLKEPTDINFLADEFLRLSYHGLRAKDKAFNVSLKTNFDSSIGKINVVPEEIGRVILNLLNNAFYAVSEKKRINPEGYEPKVSVSTQMVGDKVEIRIRDNGNGILQKVLDKIFQPFFTTKPAGQGTGLGLSMSYDIIKAHGGELKVQTKEGDGSEFIIQLSNY
ncbi:MAG: ATP-binding protein [Bacteroidia bacterium]|nr:ATP-binding protein [Bacteroidia bacterium]